MTETSSNDAIVASMCWKWFEKFKIGHFELKTWKENVLKEDTAWIMWELKIRGEPVKYRP